jgi:TatD DNase family protein
MIPLYDAHNHLQDERIDLRGFRLKGCVVNGTSEKDWGRVSELAKQHEWIVPAFGLHPWYVAERSSKWFDILRTSLDAHPNSTIGEVGLDRWMKEPNVSEQEEVFRAQLGLARERGVTASIHCLKAWGHLEEMLKEIKLPRGFLIHSYGGSTEMISNFSELGGYFSFSGYFAHERKAAQREVFKKIPLDRLLLETDAPDMLPPLPGEFNDPRNIQFVYDYAARLWDVEPKILAETMEKNFHRLFLAPSKTSG